MADTIKASVITDHAFEPRDPKQWWGLCGHEEHHLRSADNRVCGLGEAAHRETTIKRCEHVWSHLSGRRWCPKCGAEGGLA